MRRYAAFIPVLALVGAFAASASASQLVDRDARGIKLAVNGKGQALVTYHTPSGALRHVLVWGAINARQPNPTLRQVRFHLDYAGGWGTYRREVWKTFRNQCSAYAGPQLPWLVTACTAPDGSYWALQKWQVQLPDLGFVPWLPQQRAWELHISHWRGELAKLEVWSDWVYSSHFHQLFGRLTYYGQPVHGFRSTHYGAPLDGYGRLLYLDTHNSMYSRGWRRENSFLSHRSGVFCYGFFQHNPLTGGYPHPPGTPHRMRGPGIGDRYRMTVEGPGVTPDVMWEGVGVHNWTGSAADVAYEHAMNAQLDSILGGATQCKQH